MTFVNEHRDARTGLNSFEHVGMLLRHMRMEWLLRHLPPRLVWAVYVGINGFITIALLALLALSLRHALPAARRFLHWPAIQRRSS